MIQETQERNNILNRFSSLIRNDRLAHAYLFIGPENSGKSEAALEIAKLVNCIENEDGKKEASCGKCASCLKISSFNHPDVVIVDTEEGQTIKIAAIRGLIGKAQLRPYEAKRKVFIIKDIENLTPESSNALLKTLEEPSASSILILTTSVPETVFSTIRSRCHAVHFFTMSKDRIDSNLRDKIGLDQERSHFLAYFSDGCLGKAMRLSEEGFFDFKNRIIDNLVLNKDNEAFVKQLLSDKEETKEALDVLLSWFRDLVLIKSGVDDSRIVNIDRLSDLLDMEKRYSFDQLNNIVGEIVNTEKLLNGNFNIKIPFVLLREKIWIR